MKIPSISNQSVKLLSGLANNEDSLASMVLKDWIGDGATVYTYKKDGGKDDAREKAIEEFGTGAVWLFGIPVVKKIIDKTVYPIFKLDPKFDPRVLDDKTKLDNVKNIVNKTTSDVMQHQKEVFNSLDNKNQVLKRFTNSQMYKGFAVGKFLFATALSAFALRKIIKFKQKTTQDRINKDLNQNGNSGINPLLTKSLKNNEHFKMFTTDEKNNNKAPSFTGNLAEFMYNPIKNTMILDSVITGTRLLEARKGERKEVAFKEASELVFIYMLAKPIQTVFEKIGKKLKCPIELDPKILFTKDIGKKINDSKESIQALKDSTNISETLSQMAQKGDEVIDLLAKNSTISVVRDNEDKIKGIDFFKTIDENAVKKSLSQFEELGKNIKNIGKIKAFKTFAVIGNVLIAAGAMGILQPKLNILMRKLLNNGDNRNPAIINQEELAQNKGTSNV